MGHYNDIQRKKLNTEKIHIEIEIDFLTSFKAIEHQNIKLILKSKS